jgi:hypothetical protein
MVLTVSFVLSPVTGLVCHCRQRNDFRQLDASVGASGPHDFAVRINTVRRSAHPRPPHPVPTSVTIAIRPSCGTGWREFYIRFDFGKTEIFLPARLDRAEAQTTVDLPVGQTMRSEIGFLNRRN